MLGEQLFFSFFSVVFLFVLFLLGDTKKGERVAIRLVFFSSFFLSVSSQMRGKERRSLLNEASLSSLIFLFTWLSLPSLYRVSVDARVGVSISIARPRDRAYRDRRRLGWSVSCWFLKEKQVLVFFVCCCFGSRMQRVMRSSTLQTWSAWRAWRFRHVYKQIQEIERESSKFLPKSSQFS